MSAALVCVRACVPACLSHAFVCCQRVLCLCVCRYADVKAWIQICAGRPGPKPLTRIIKLKGVDNRDAALGLRGCKVYVRDSDLGAVNQTRASKRSDRTLSSVVSTLTAQEAKVGGGDAGQQDDGYYIHEIVGLTCLKIPDSIFDGLLVQEGEAGDEGAGAEAEKTEDEEEGVMLDPDDCATIGKVIGVIPADEVSSIPGLGQDLLEVRLGDEARGNIDDETVLSHYIMPYM